MRSLNPLAKRVDHHFEASVRSPPNFPPPTHFNNPKSIPKTYGDLQRSRDAASQASQGQQPIVDNLQQLTLTQTQALLDSGAQSPRPLGDPHHYEDQSQQRHNSDFVKDLVLLATMFSLIYLTLDNYIGRIRAEKLQAETAAISARTKQLLQTRFKQQTQQRDVQILAERKKVSRRDFKMSLHIAILRQQLKELGVEPKDIDQALKEFDTSVKIDNSIHNVSGQALWLDDMSPLKEYLPDVHEYDRQGNNKE